MTTHDKNMFIINLHIRVRPKKKTYTCKVWGRTSQNHRPKHVTRNLSQTLGRTCRLHIWLKMQGCMFASYLVVAPTQHVLVNNDPCYRRIEYKKVKLSSNHKLFQPCSSKYSVLFSFFHFLPFVSAYHQTRYPKAKARFSHNILQWQSN